MESILLPSKVEYQVDRENKNKGTIIIEPCYPGYGTTLGNAMRRVLLSSLTGAAVDAVKIKGARHEFSTLPYIKEDVLQIVLNLKLLRVKIYKDEPVKLKLSVRGEKKVTAADFEKNPDVEIINPDLHLATLTDKKANLEMEVTVKRGMGYVPSEEKDRTGIDLGTIVMDSIFSPVLKVGFRVEKIRVGQRTDFDKLILEVTTDGTISPMEAFIEASKILIEQFKFLNQNLETKRGELEKEAEKSEKKTTKKKKTTIKRGKAKK
jgi:DNA-directed RNA polymerase subunit alpha